jgi:hypothetical protein
MRYHTRNPTLCSAQQGQRIGLCWIPCFFFDRLGVCLGLYMPCLTYAPSLMYVKDQRRSIASAYLRFSLALLIALFLLIFPACCSFTCEVMVILAML